MQSTAALSATPRLRPGVRLQWDAARANHVLLMPESILALNVTGAEILALCDGQRTIAAIVAHLVDQYGRPVSDDVMTFLLRLRVKHALEWSDE